MRRLHLLLAAFLLAALPVHGQSYDPEAETERLIARAAEEKAKASQDLERLRAAEQRSKQDFLLLNNTAYELGQTLKKIRTVDARNKALLLVKTGLNITAVNAPEKLLEVGVNITVDAGSETLKNNFPGLFDTSVTVELPRLGADSVKAVKDFNDILAYSDEDVSNRLKKEVPELARDRGALYELVAGGKLNDDLIALKRAEYLIKAGTKAEAALNALKALLSQKRQEQLNAIAALEHDIKMRDEDIRVWKKSAAMGRQIRELSKVEAPEKVSWEANPKYDFGTAAQKMRDAMEKIKANRLDCDGYSTQSGNAYAGAWNRFMELFQQMWAANCSNYSSDQCRNANARFDATVRQDFKNQIENTVNQLSKQMEEAANGPAGAFMRRLQKWQDTTLLVPGDWWDLKGQEIKIGGAEGGDLANAIFGYALLISPEPVKDWFPPAVGGLSLEGLRWPTYTLRSSVEPSIEQAQTLLKNFDIMLDYARKSASTGQAAAADAEDMAGQLEPHRHFWGCALRMGDLTGTYLNLKRFSPTFTPVADAAAQRAQQVHEVFQKGANATQSLYSALAPEKSVLETWAKGEDMKLQMDESAAAAGAQMFRNLSPYPLWSQLKAQGITEATVKDITEILPKLANPEEAIKDYNGRQATGLGAKPILREDAITSLTTRLKKDGANAIASQSEYRDRYNQLARLQASLNSQVNALKGAVESITGKPSGIGAPMLLDESLYMLPNDLPDPTAGVFELVEKYAKAAAAYHARMDALQSWTFPVYPEMEKLLKKVETEGGGKAGGDENQFRDWWNTCSQEWSKLQRAAAAGSRLPISNAAPFGKLSGQVMARLGELSSQVATRNRLTRATEELTTLLNRGNDFLAHAAAQGGPAMALDWLRNLADPAKPGSDAYEVRSHPAIASLLTQIGALRSRLEAYLASGSDTVVKKFYQDFAAAYQSRNLPAVLRFLAPDWQADGGSDLRDLEDTLGNSFRIFDTIQVSITGLSVRVVGTGYQASYTIKLIGQMRRMSKSHEESAQVVDTLVSTPEGFKIQRTSGGLNWSPR